MEESDDLLKVLANETNQRILLALVPEPSHSRLLASSLGLNETEVSRRLKKLEKLGLVVGKWARAEANVKRYHLAAEGIELRFGPGGLEVHVRGRDALAAGAARKQVWHFELPETPNYVPRAHEEAAVVSPGPRVLVILGVAGVGKTFLGVTAARAHPGPVLWQTLRATDTFGRVFHRAAAFADQHGEPEPLRLWSEGQRDPDTLLASLAAALDRKRAMVVFDDYHTVKEDDVLALVHGLLRDLKTARLVLTTRERPRYLPPQVPHQVVMVGGFTLDEARAFLATKGLTLDEPTLATVHARTHGHPILLNLYAETKLLRGEGALPPADADAQAYLWDAFYAALTEEERRVIEAASVWHSRFTREGLQALLPGEPIDLRLYTLERRLLVQRRGEDAFALHELIKGFAYATARGKAKLHAAAATHCQALGTVQGHLEAIDHRLRAGDPQKAAALLTRNLDLTEIEVVDLGYHALYRDILSRFPEKEVPADVWTVILDERGDLALTTGHPEEALALYEQAAARLAPGDADHRADLAWKRARALARLGKRKEAEAVAAEGLQFAKPGTQAALRLQEFLQATD
ncbi:MAG TPA: hypothetical protein VNZ52_03730 [Candidatus Thermoplasmatota archaeon]|nr:hypothetical protein [Candidatus Thermoplasmatota archaeon]